MSPSVMSHGLLMQGNYVFGNAYVSSRYSLARRRKQPLQTGDPGQHHPRVQVQLGLRAAVRQRPHLLRPVRNGWVDRADRRLGARRHRRASRAAAWSISATCGSSACRVKDLQKAYGQLRVCRDRDQPDGAVSNIYMLPQDILENTVQRVQHERDEPDRLRQPRRADRPLHRPRERAGLHRERRERLRGLRLRTVVADRSDVSALGSQRGEADARWSATRCSSSAPT